MLIDLACIVGSFVLAYALKFGNISFSQSSSWRGLLALLLLVSLVITLYAEPYSGVLRRGYWDDIGAYLKLTLASFLTICVVFYLFKVGENYSREMLVTTYLIYLVTSLPIKAVWKKALLSYWGSRPDDSYLKVILVTDDADPAEMGRLASADDIGAYSIVGYCLVEPERGASDEIDGTPVVTPSGLVKLASSTNADVALITVDPSRLGSKLLEELVEDGIRVSLAITEALGVSTETQALGHVGVFKTLDLDRYTFGDGQLLYQPVKRLADVVFGVIGCVLTVLAAIGVKIAYVASGDMHPIMYRQTRIGLRGVEFGMWKFRSMVWNADELLEELLKDPALKKEWDTDQKLENDPRITKIGKFLRRTSLDEFPQFINVLTGDMSVIGPRPLVPGELEAHGGRGLYNKVKPGITGWWGCNGRSNIEYRERLELEYHYVRHCSLYLDLLCFFRTFVAVLKKDGAR